MPWATLKARPKLEMEVIPDNGHRYVVTWFAGEAYLPLHIYNYLIRQGLIERGDKPDPRPQFEKAPGCAMHGKAISPFADYVREVAT
jgi:hypothetical protein